MLNAKEFRESVEAGKDTLDGITQANGMKIVRFLVKNKKTGKIDILDSEIYLKGFSCAEYARYYGLIAQQDTDGKPVEGAISKFAAAVIIGAYDKDPADGGKPIFDASHAKWLECEMNAKQTLILFADVMAITGATEDAANVEKPD